MQMKYEMIEYNQEHLLQLKVRPNCIYVHSAADLQVLTLYTVDT